MLGVCPQSVLPGGSKKPGSEDTLVMGGDLKASGQPQDDTLVFQDFIWGLLHNRIVHYNIYALDE